MLEASILVIFPILVAFAGASDLFTMKIPNRVSLLLIAGFFVLAVSTGLSVFQIGMHLAGFAIVLFLCFGMFAMGWMGGGDAKIASAIALWLGFGPDLVYFVVLVAFFGMGLTILLLNFKSLPVLPSSLARQDWIARLHDPQTGVPYGIAISASALLVYPETYWFSQIL